MMMDLLAYALLAATMFDMVIGKGKVIYKCTTRVLEIRYKIHIFETYDLLIMAFFRPHVVYFMAILATAILGNIIRKELIKRGE